MTKVFISCSRKDKNFGHCSEATDNRLQNFAFLALFEYAEAALPKTQQTGGVLGRF